ncbi:MAG: cell division protein FtsZ, partial [Phenylobacterium sp.]|nr:cell division protein FtsZ [Phenylobacterium sp.]
ASGEDRALMAAQNAIQNPLLDEVSLKGAKAVLVNVTGGLDMTLLEVDEAANAISEQVDPEGNIIFGAAFDPTLEGMIRVSVVATGMDGASIAAIEPKVERRPLTAPPLRATEQAHQPYTPPPVPAPEPVRSIYATPAAQAPAPRYEAPAYRAPVAAAPAPAPTPAPKASFDEDLEAQGDLYAAAPAPTPAPAPVRVEPQITQAAAPPPAPPMTRIVDPSVADDEDEPLFADAAFEDRRPQRSGGFLSLFGSRPRYDAPAPAPAARPAARGGAQPAEAPAPQEQVEGQEDLEIPSFLRRLAN